MAGIYPIVIIFFGLVSASVNPDTPSYLLREYGEGFYVLQENGDKIILENNLV